MKAKCLTAYSSKNLYTSSWMIEMALYTSLQSSHFNILLHPTNDTLQ